MVTIMMIIHIINHGQKILDPALLYLRMYAHMYLYVSLIYPCIRTSLSSGYVHRFNT